MFYVNIVLRVFQSLFVFGITLLFLGGLLGAGIGLGYMAYLVQDTPTPTKTELQKDIGDITETSKLVYSDNSDIATIKSDLLRTSVTSEEISPLVKKALIATEDENFETHNGVVPKAVLRALISDITGLGSGSGGSTITQQLVKQQVLTSETSFKRKASEIMLAMEVEKYLSKDEILTAYLNVSPFGRNNKGQNIAGVQEAALGIFGVNAKDLTLPQAAFIAGLPQSPIVYSPYTNTGDLKDDYSSGLKRKDAVLFNMYRENIITKQEYEDAKSYDLSQDFLKRQNIEQEDRGFLYYTVYNEAVELLARKNAKEDGVSDADLADDTTYQAYHKKAETELQNGGYTVRSTIDKTVYNTMQSAASDFGYLLDNGSGTTIETGNVLMDNATGAIYGFIGSRDYAANQFNHAFDSKRQSGSTIKPLLVYGPALEDGLIGSESMVSDYATSWGANAGDNEGEAIVNSTNKGTNTFMTVREALEVSSNIAAVHVSEELKAKEGSDTYAFDNYLAKMNFPASDSWSVPSAPLGTVDVTTVTQTNGFQTIANDGVYQEGYTVESITDNEGNVIYQHEADPVQIYNAATATILQDLLRSVISAGRTSKVQSMMTSLNYALGTNDWIGKTGTTNDWVDSWLMLSNPQVTFSSWNGRDDSKATDSGAGTRNATFTANVLNRIYQAKPELFDNTQKFTLSSDVKSLNVSDVTGDTISTFTYDKTNYKDPGKTVSSLWATGTPAKSSFEFGIGGTVENYKDYWAKQSNALVKKTAAVTTPSSEKKTEEKTDDKTADNTDNKTDDENKTDDKTDDKTETGTNTEAGNNTADAGTNDKTETANQDTPTDNQATPASQ